MNISDQTINWLLEENNPSIRYLTLKNIKKLKSSNKILIQARKKTYTTGPIHEILKQMKPEGYWFKPGHGYSPKYKGTVWTLITLSQLGACIQDDKRVKIACNYYLNNALKEDGKFTATGNPSGTIDCLQGNMCAALMEMGCNDPRLDLAYEWLARSNIGDKVEKYYAYKCGPKYVCGVNNKLLCAWGATKALKAFSKLPSKKKTIQINKAIKIGVEELLGIDPALAIYPTRDGAKTSRNWWKFGFPVFYISDILQIVEALVDLGYGKDPRLQNAINLIYKKQNDRERWNLEYSYETLFNYGRKRQENKWVTYRAVNALLKI